MNSKIKKGSMGGILALVAFTLFVASLLMVLLTGADAVQKLNERDQSSYDRRTVVQYITTRIRQGDQRDMVEVREMEGRSVLTLKERIEDVDYETYVYCYDGYLCELFVEAGLEMEQGGVLVDETLQTSAPDVYAAGDIATFEDPLLGRRRVEHMANAERSGDAAGRTMAGNHTGYRYTPLFWSDLFDDGYEALGETRTSHRVEEVWNDAHDAAVLYYLDRDRVRGVLMWNTWGAVSKAREVMEASKEGRLPLSELADQITPGG